MMLLSVYAIGLVLLGYLFYFEIPAQGMIFVIPVWSLLPLLYFLRKWKMVESPSCIPERCPNPSCCLAFACSQTTAFKAVTFDACPKCGTELHIERKTASCKDMLAKLECYLNGNMLKLIIASFVTNILMFSRFHLLDRCVPRPQLGFLTLTPAIGGAAVGIGLIILCFTALWMILSMFIKPERPSCPLCGWRYTFRQSSLVFRTGICMHCGGIVVDGNPPEKGVVAEDNLVPEPTVLKKFAKMIVLQSVAAYAFFGGVFPYLFAGCGYMKYPPVLGVMVASIAVIIICILMIYSNYINCPVCRKRICSGMNAMRMTRRCPRCRNVIVSATPSKKD